MRLVIQRVKEASVKVKEELISKIGKGLMVLVGVENEDTEKDAEWLAYKTVNLRLFPDTNDVMNHSVKDIGGEIMAVSQFTLTASTRKGHRPSYIRAARPEMAEPLYHKFCEILREMLGKEIKKGIFGADMQVGLVNDGPVTIILDTKLKE